MEVMIRAREAGPPCRMCRWFVPPGQPNPVGYPPEQPPAYCGHVALAQQYFDAATGKMPLVTQTTIEEARGPDGLCGFEGMLFEYPRGFFGRLVDRSEEYSRSLGLIGIGLVAGAWIGFVASLVLVAG